MSGHTTYSRLTQAAARSLALGIADNAAHAIPDQQAALAAIQAHRNLTAALAHLGRALTQPPGSQPPIPEPGREAQPTPAQAAARTIQKLERRGAKLDWDSPQSSNPTALAWNQSARQLRVASRSAATHRDQAGNDRSPDAVRLRHPAFIGSAVREWNTLVTQAGQAARSLEMRAQQVGVTVEERRAIASFPRPTPSQPTPPTQTAIDPTVARPGIRTNAGPLVELADRINAMRHYAWSLANSEVTPAQTLRNLAAVGAMLNNSAAQTSRAAAAITPPGTERTAFTAAADTATRSGDAWRSVSQAITHLRTASPRDHSIELERMRIAKLINQVTSPTGPPSRDTAPTLSALAEGFDEVAGWSAQALRAEHNLGRVHLAGAGIPNDLASRYHAAAVAKLNNDLIPAPNLTMRRIGKAYAGVPQARTITTAPNIEPPSL